MLNSFAFHDQRNIRTSSPCLYTFSLHSTEENWNFAAVWIQILEEFSVVLHSVSSSKSPPFVMIAILHAKCQISIFIVFIIKRKLLVKMFLYSFTIFALLLTLFPFFELGNSHDSDFEEIFHSKNILKPWNSIKTASREIFRPFIEKWAEHESIKLYAETLIHISLNTTATRANSLREKFSIAISYMLYGMEKMEGIFIPLWKIFGECKCSCWM